MAASASLSFSDSLSASWLSDSDWYFQLQDLPNEVLLLILGYLPLPDLANIRLVCTRLQKLVDDHGCRYLWAKATLEGSCQWLSQDNKQIIQRAAGHGNVEALIMLAVAHLYSEGVPEGTGKGTYNAHNGIKATEYLIKAEELTAHMPPFSWVLFRPPWASNKMCCKACVCQRMKEHCEQADTDAAPIGLHYCIGKVLAFFEASEEAGADDDRDAAHWFELGSDVDCLHSALEVWRRNYKPNLCDDPYEAMRRLRGIISHGGSKSFLHEARLELCFAYSRGFYGGKSKDQALTYVREVMANSRAVLWDRIHQLQETITHSVRYILIDWIIEVAGMKYFSPQTVHLAINLIDRYLIHRSISRSKLQLLGVTALLVAARWSSDYILTVREASWLTEETYQYEDVVRMMGGLVAAFKGEVKRETVCDYLDVMLDLISANTSTRNMAYYLSEALLLHAKFGRYSAAHLAAACLLEARILLGQEYPWPQCMVEATGFTVSGLRKCCLAIYDECLTDKNLVTDYRKIKLEAVASRYASDMFGNVSKHELMSYKDLKEHLGVDPDSSYLLFTPTPKPPRQMSKTDKLLSFLSDSCYLTPGRPGSSLSTNHSPLFSVSDSESIGSHSSSRSKHSDDDPCLDIRSSLVEQFDAHSNSSSLDCHHFDLSPSEFEGLPVSSPYSPSCCSSQSLTINQSASGFPQPLFSECDLSLTSDFGQESPSLNPGEKTVEVTTASAMASSVEDEPVSADYSQVCKRAPFVQDEMMDTDECTVSVDELQNSHLSLKKFVLSQNSTDVNTPFEARPIRQGAEETPFDLDVPLHNLPAKQKLTLSVSEALKSDECKVNGRVALKPLNVGTVVSPDSFYGNKSYLNEDCKAGHFVTSTNGAVKHRQGRRKKRAVSRK